MSGLNTPFKIGRLLEWRKNTKAHLYAYLEEIHFRYNDTNRLKEKGWKKIYHTNSNLKKAGVAIVISDKTVFKHATREQEGHLIIIKGSIH